MADVGILPSIKPSNSYESPRVDLDDYSARKQSYLKNKGMCCVYVVGTVEARPIKIGVAQNVRSRIGNLQTATFIKMVPYFILWTIGKPIALRIETDAHLALAAVRQRGEWFDVDAYTASSVVVKMALATFPELGFWNHSALMARLRAKKLDRCDRGG